MDSPFNRISLLNSSFLGGLPSGVSNCGGANQQVEQPFFPVGAFHLSVSMKERTELGSGQVLSGLHRSGKEANSVLVRSDKDDVNLAEDSFGVTSTGNLTHVFSENFVEM